MSFIYPSFLWALSAVAIPIIIHLFNFRTHKIVYFSNVAFLQNIEQETKSRNTLKELLILLMRILAIVCLVLAFAKPVILDKTNKANADCSNSYSIYLDNSFSMTAINPDGSNIETAKSKASDILNAFKQNTEYIFLTNEFDPQQQHYYIKDITQNNISKTEVTPIYRKASFVFSKFSNLLNTELNCTNTLFYISDFQKNTFDIKNIDTDSNLKVVLLPVEPNETSNLFIDSVWFLSPQHLYKSNDSMIVSIVNNSDVDFANQQIKLFINDTLKTLSNFNIQANSKTQVKLIFSNTVQGFISGHVEIEDYPVTYDNKMFFNYYIAPRIKVLLIEGKSQTYLRKFYNDLNYFELKTVPASNIPINELFKYQAIIYASAKQISSGLSNQLTSYIEKGGVLALIPGLDANLNSINSFLSKVQLPVFTTTDTNNVELDYINLEDKIYKNAFKEIEQNSEMAEIYSHLKFNNNYVNVITELLSLENDDILLFYKEIKKGRIYVFSTEMKEFATNFMVNPVSVPTFYNIPVLSKANYKIYHIIGQSENIVIKNIKDFEVIKLRNQQTNFEFFPQAVSISDNNIKINISDVSPKAGNYEILNKDKKVGLISLNYNRLESDLDYFNTKELNQLLKKHNLKNWQITENSGTVLQKDIQNKIEGKNFWKLFIIFALVFILSEILIIRLMKN